MCVCMCGMYVCAYVMLCMYDMLCDVCTHVRAEGMDGWKDVYVYDASVVCTMMYACIMMRMMYYGVQ